MPENEKKKIYKILRWLIPFLAGGVLSLISWFIDEKIQLYQFNNTMKIIKEINTPNIEVIEDLLRPSTFTLSRLVFTILFFFFSSIVTDYFLEKIIIRKNQNEDIDKNLNIFDIDSTEDFIAGFLDHLSEECFSKCSNVSSKCSSCDKFPNNCDGLLRNYLFHEASDLRDAIRNAKKGEYLLATNIEKYHTIAIEHLIVSKSMHYKVIQWIGSEDTVEETYDRLDFHFLNSLLSKITEIVTNEKKPYYEKHKFKIKWLLIGDIDKMKNNFDYIFYIINKMGLKETVNKFFEFYIMTEEKYQTKSDPLTATYNDLIKNKLVIDKKHYKPSFGIFGSHFIFEDASDANQHGTIYTKMYKIHGISSAENLVDELNIFFDKMLHKEKATMIDLLFTKYNDIITNDTSWEKALEKKWRP